MPHANPKSLPCLPGRLWRDRDGASLLEFTVVLPFLIAFGFGVLEFGNALYQYHMITNGVRDAGRYLASAGYVGAVVDGVVEPVDPDNVDPDESRRTNAKKIAVCGEIASCTTDAAKRVPWWPADIADIEDAIEVQYCLNGVAEGDAIDGCDCDDPPALNPDPGFGSSKVCVRTIAEYDDVGFLGSLGLGPITFTIGHEQRYYGIR